MYDQLITWTGASGVPYHTVAHPLRSILPPVSAVYIVCKWAPLGWFALYVGESGNLYERLTLGATSHEGLQRASRAGATHVCILETAGQANRLRIETDLRHGLRPPCNEQSVNALSALLGY